MAINALSKGSSDCKESLILVKQKLTQLQRDYEAVDSSNPLLLSCLTSLADRSFEVHFILLLEAFPPHTIQVH